jgi:excisionase family DNA binding protein
MAQLTERLFKPKEVADMLSYSLATIYRLIDSGRLPVVKIRSGLRIRASDIERLIRVNTENRGTQKRNWRTG